MLMLIEKMMDVGCKDSAKPHPHPYVPAPATRAGLELETRYELLLDKKGNLGKNDAGK